MFDEVRLRRLIAAYFDQQLKPDEKSELEAMLMSSSRARGIFLDYAEWHGLIREWALRRSSVGSASDIDAIQDPKPPRLQRRPHRRLWMGAGIAACLLLTWSIFHHLVAPGKEAAKNVTEDIRKEKMGTDVAMLGQTTGVIWNDGTSPIPTGSPLPKGWLHISKGTLRLDFYSGAILIVDGPASLELISTDLVRLEKGRLTANVPPPAEGFTVLSANLRVVDRGTEFGMSVEKPGDCEVHVFKGEVELQGDLPASGVRELREGHALAIREGGVTPMRADRKSFTDPAALHRVDVLETETRWRNWRESSRAFRSTPDLAVYFDFEKLEPGNPLIPNLASGASPDSSGTVIGCERLSGRWPEKGAIGFTKTSDRIRFVTSGESSSLTLMAWVRVDSLLMEHSSLLSMSPEEVGEVHWKLGKSGRLLLGLRASRELRYDSWERLEGPVVVTERELGRWMHLASVIDGETGMMRHYLNGEEVASGRITRPTPVRLGLANLGNFDALPGQRVKYGTGRSFNGRIDEFALIRRSLGSQEIREAAR